MRWRRWRGWLTAVLLAACVDGPTSPGLFGELRIRPSYSDGDAPAALGLAVDSAKVRVVRVSEPAIAIIDTMVRYESDTASMGWVLTLRSEEEPLLVNVAIWDEDARVYSGESEVVVREAAIAESGAEPVLVAYVGPAIAKTVAVSPGSVTLEALNATASYTAEARDRHGVVIATPFSWTTGDPNVATVDATSGAVSAVGNGTTTIQATSGAASGSATVVVAQRVATVGITPDGATLTELGATRELQATVSDANGFAVVGASVRWASSDAGIARVNEAGTVTAVSGGVATITASSGGIDATVQVTVNPTANVASVTVSPGNASLSAVGATQQFTAVARDADGNVLPGVQFIWTSVEEGVATIDASGVATARGHGTTTVGAIAGSAGGGATLVVDLTATVAQVVVAPAAATLRSLGATQQFTAEARDAGGAVVPGVTPAWSSEHENVATVDAVTGVATAVGHGASTILATVGGMRGSAALTVELTTSIATISVVPAALTLTSLDATQQYHAEARDATGAVIPGISFSWTSSATDVATIGATTGLATVTGNGSTTITASANGRSGAATLTADLDETIASIVVSPSSATLTTMGATQQFTAVARDANNAIVSGVTFTWSSSLDAVATVDPATGLATVVGHGTTNIVASIGTVHGGATLTANLLPLVWSIAVTPASVTLTMLGATQQFTAEARDASGAVIPGVPFTWVSSATGVATIGEISGLATVTGDGVATISASAHGASATALLTADLASSVTSIVVSPLSPVLTTRGATQQFTAVARDANNTIVPGVPFTWSTAHAPVATIDPVTGRATAEGHGFTTIIAAIGDVQGTASLTVNLTTTVASIMVTPATVTLGSLGATQQFTAEAHDGTGAVINGMTVVWSSSEAEVATIGHDSGLAQVTGHGSTTITASVNGVSGTATLTADLIELPTSIVVTPANATLTSLGATQQFTAEARDGNGTLIPGIPVVWSSTSESVAGIDPVTGLATAARHGSTTIVATIGEVEGTASLAVNLTTDVASIVVSPATSTLTSMSATQQFTAEARDASGSVVPGMTFVWSSNAEHVATIGATSGLASVTGNGAATITASANDVSGTATLTADVVATVTSIVVSPATAQLTAKGATQPFTAVARDADNAIVPGVSFVWSSSNELVASVDPATGLAAATGHGSTNITAAIGNVQGSATLSVDLAPTVARVVVSPANASLHALGQTHQFTAEARDAGGDIVPGISFAWSTSLADVTTIDESTGLATAVGNGSVTVTATAGDIAGTAQLTVQQQIARVAVTPASVTVVPGSLTPLTATAYDANDHVVSGQTFTWSTTNKNVARVNAEGVVEALALGTATIRATVNGISGGASVTVECALPPQGNNLLASIIVC